MTSRPRRAACASTYSRAAASWVEARGMAASASKCFHTGLGSNSASAGIMTSSVAFECNAMVQRRRTPGEVWAGLQVRGSGDGDQEAGEAGPSDRHGGTEDLFLFVLLCASVSLGWRITFVGTPA